MIRERTWMLRLLDIPSIGAQPSRAASRNSEVLSDFPEGTTFYEWKQLPVARVPGSDEAVWMVCSEEPPRVLSGTAIRASRAEPIDEVTFERLRAAYLAAHRVAGF